MGTPGGVSSIGGWKVDTDSIYAKGTSNAPVIDMISTYPRIDVRDLSPASTVSYDTFTDTNGTLLGAHTPDVGSGWVDIRYTSIQYYEIQNNRCHLNDWSIEEYVGVDIGVAVGHTITCILKVPPNNGQNNQADGFRIITRYVSDYDRVFVFFNPFSNAYQIEVRYSTGGSTILNFDSGASSVNWVYGGWNYLKVVAGADNRIHVYVNDILYVTSNPLPYALSSTKAGMYHQLATSTNWSNGYWDVDDWKVTYGGANRLRTRIGKVGNTATDYGIAAWDAEGNQILDPEGLGDGLFLYDKFTVPDPPVYTYTLTETPAVNSAVVFRNGLALEPDDFSISGTTLTIDSNQVTLVAGDILVVHYTR